VLKVFSGVNLIEFASLYQGKKNSSRESSLGVNGSMVRDLMIESAKYRFGKLNRLPHAIQWLSDNSSCYTAHETVKFGRTLGFEICTTPSYSPESNGLAEAFVKSFK